MLQSLFSLFHFLTITFACRSSSSSSYVGPEQKVGALRSNHSNGGWCLDENIQESGGKKSCSFDADDVRDESSTRLRMGGMTMVDVSGFSDSNYEASDLGGFIDFMGVGRT